MIEISVTRAQANLLRAVVGDMVRYRPFVVEADRETLVQVLDALTDDAVEDAVMSTTPLGDPVGEAAKLRVWTLAASNLRGKLRNALRG